MKLTREITGAINRRAYALGNEAMQTFAAAMKAEFERGSLLVEGVADWVPVQVSRKPGKADPGLDATDHLAGF